MMVGRSGPVDTAHFKFKITKFMLMYVSAKKGWNGTNILEGEDLNYWLVRH